MLETVRDHVLSGQGPYSPKGFDEAVPVSSADGVRYLLPRVTPVYSEMGSIVGATLVLQDVSRLRRFDELKNDLFATVAHEFRTPLTSLRMAIHLCIEEAGGPITEKQADLLYAAREDCERLQTIVDELLDLARIQGGRMLLKPQPTPVAGLVDTAVATHGKAAEDKKIRLRAAVLPGVPDVFADRERAQLVLSNLITNAIRHTPEGGNIEVRARLAEPPSDQPEGPPAPAMVRFEVEDSGEGIPVEIQGMIFEKFFRAPGAPAGGAGLGLPIAREIVTAHGGEIGLTSAPGRGSTFWFTLPVSDLPPS
jgi:signal transduction histidine kinase